MLRGAQSPSFHSFANGFLPDQDPLRRLPHEKECPLSVELNLIATQLPILIKSRALRSTINSLNEKYSQSPLINVNQLNAAEVNVAFTTLMMLEQAYMWEQSDQPASMIPRLLAENIFHLIAHCPRVPVLTYADYVLYNWRRMDESKGITLDNIEPLVTFTGSMEEAWFIKIHVVVEAAFSQAIASALKIYSVAERPADMDVKAVFSKHFARIAESIEQATVVLERMYEQCSPSFFFNVLRPYLEGTEKMKGIQFDMPVHKGKVYLYRGSSGAQSSTLPVLDAILAVPHANDQMAQTLQTFLDYMPAAHKEFIMCLKQNKVEAALPAINEQVPERRQAIGKLWQLRLKHLHLPADYIVRQAREHGLPLDQLTGTGSTSIGLFLNKRAKNTLEAAIRQGWTPQAKL